MSAENITGSEPEYVNVMVDVDEELFEKVKDLAKKENVTVSEMARRIVREYIESLYDEAH